MWQNKITYPVQCNCLLSFSFKPQRNDNTKGEETNSKEAIRAQNELPKVLLLFNRVGEAGNTVMQQERICEQRHTYQPPSPVKSDNYIV